MKRQLLLISIGMALMFVGRVTPLPYGVLIEVVGVGFLYATFWWLDERDLRNALVVFFLLSILLSILSWIGSAP